MGDWVVALAGGMQCGACGCGGLGVGVGGGGGRPMHAWPSTMVHPGRRLLDDDAAPTLRLYPACTSMRLFWSLSGGRPTRRLGS